MRFKAGMTIEASYIFPFTAMLVAAFIMLDFKLYDGVLNDSVKILGGLRYHAAETYYYDSTADEINYIQKISAPILSKNTTFTSAQKMQIGKSIYAAYEKGCLNVNDRLTDTDIEKVIKSVDNAGTVRAGGRIVQIIGGKNGD